MSRKKAAIGAGRRRREVGRGLLGRAVGTTRGKIGLAMVGAVLIVVIIGPTVAPYSSTQFVGIPFASPSGNMLLGGDVLGRDVLSRVLYGGRELLIVAVLGTALGVVVGATLGIVAGYMRGAVETSIMRVVDVLLAFPQLVLALLLVSLAGPKPYLIVIAIGLGHVPQVARVVRGATVQVSELDFVKVVEMRGLRSWRVLVREVVPNLTSVLAVEVGLRLTFSILVIAGLGFLGFAQPPPAANWGLMVNENMVGITINVWSVVAPLILIGVLTIGMNTFTDAVARVSIGIEGRKDDLIVMGMEAGQVAA